MKRTTVFIDEALDAELKLLARREAKPAASMMREAIAQYVAAKRTPLQALGFVGIGRSGHRDTAERHDQLLWRKLAPHGAAPKRRAAPRKKSRP
jgi:hypothetical protein